LLILLIDIARIVDHHCFNLPLIMI